MVQVLRVSLLRYEKSISDDLAFIISKGQSCPTSSVPEEEGLDHMIATVNKDSSIKKCGYKLNDSSQVDVRYVSAS